MLARYKGGSVDEREVAQCDLTGMDASRMQAWETEFANRWRSHAAIAGRFAGTASPKEQLHSFLVHWSQLRLADYRREREVAMLSSASKGIL